jgi:ferredoxin
VRHPQLLVYQGDARLVALLEPAAEAARWWLRKPGDLAECLEVLPRGGPSVLVIRLGRDLEGELVVLERVCRLFPDAAAVVVGEADQAPLAGLARDLGARFTLFPPVSLELLPGVVSDATLCTGCGDCVAVCPTACLEMREALPWLPRPADCVSCALCGAVCPADAITVPAIPPYAKDKGRRR